MIPSTALRRKQTVMSSHLLFDLVLVRTHNESMWLLIVRIYLIIGLATAIAILSWPRLRGPNSEVTQRPFVTGVIATLEWPIFLVVVIRALIAKRKERHNP